MGHLCPRGLFGRIGTCVIGRRGCLGYRSHKIDILGVESRFVHTLDAWGGHSAHTLVLVRVGGFGSYSRGGDCGCVELHGPWSDVFRLSPGWPSLKIAGWVLAPGRGCSQYVQWGVL